MITTRVHPQWHVYPSLQKYCLLNLELACPSSNWAKLLTDFFWEKSKLANVLTANHLYDDKFLFLAKKNEVNFRNRRSFELRQKVKYIPTLNLYIYIYIYQIYITGGLYWNGSFAASDLFHKLISIHSIATWKEYRCLKNVIHQNVSGKIWVGFCRNTGKHFFLVA